VESSFAATFTIGLMTILPHLAYPRRCRATVEMELGAYNIQTDSKGAAKTASPRSSLPGRDGSQLPPERRLSASALLPNARIPAPAIGEEFWLSSKGISPIV